MDEKITIDGEDNQESAMSGHVKTLYETASAKAFTASRQREGKRLASFALSGRRTREAQATGRTESDAAIFGGQVAEQLMGLAVRAPKDAEHGFIATRPVGKAGRPDGENSLEVRPTEEGGLLLKITKKTGQGHVSSREFSVSGEGQVFQLVADEPHRTVNQVPLYGSHEEAIHRSEGEALRAQSGSSEVPPEIDVVDSIASDLISDLEDFAGVCGQSSYSREGRYKNEAAYPEGSIATLPALPPESNWEINFPDVAA